MSRPLGELSREDCVRIAQAFAEARGPDGFVSTAEGKRCLQATGLSDQRLQRVWHLSDLDRDGRLSLREFACAIHLAGQAKRGRELPVEVTLADQDAVAREVEQVLNGGGFQDMAQFSADGGPSSEVAPPGAGGLGVSSAAAGGTPRGRDRSTRSLPNLGGLGGVGGLSRLGEGAPKLSPAEGEVALSQLASVFETVARLDASGDIRRLSREVLEERRELERQLTRRRDLEHQLQECHGHLELLREERRRADIEAVAAKRQIGHLQDELVFVERESKDAEEDLAVLRAAGDLAPSGVAGDGQERRGPAPYNSAEEERRDVLSKVRAEREILQRDRMSIEECRAKLEEVFKQKLDAQLLQQTLLEKQRQAEHDRGLMLTAIEAERGKLSAMRAERIKMWEERSILEREMTDVVQERWLAAHQPPGQGRAAAAAQAQAAQLQAGGTWHPAPAGAPAAASMRSGGAGGQRLRGVRQSDPPPAVVGGSEGRPEVRGGLPERMDLYGIDGGRTPGLGTLLGGMPSGGGGGGYPAARPLGVENDSLGRAAATQRRKADSRGVRNDDAVGMPVGNPPHAPLGVGAGIAGGPSLSLDGFGGAANGAGGAAGGWDYSFAGGPGGLVPLGAAGRA